MTRLAFGVLRALDPPLRFLLGCLFALSAALLGCMQIRPVEGFPWPGRVEYGPPPLEALLLGLIVAGALSAARCAPRAGRATGAVTLLFLGLGAAAVVHGLAPEAGVLRLLALAVAGITAVRWSSKESRQDVIRSAVLMAFTLVLLKFVILEGLGDAARAMWLGALAQPELPPGDEYRVFLVLVLFAAAVAARWEDLPPEPREAVTAVLPKAAVPEALPAPEPEAQALPEPAKALPESTGEPDPDGGERDG